MGSAGARRPVGADAMAQRSGTTLPICPHPGSSPSRCDRRTQASVPWIQRNGEFAGKLPVDRDLLSPRVLRQQVTGRHRRGDLLSEESIGATSFGELNVTRQEDRQGRLVYGYRGPRSVVGNSRDETVVELIWRFTASPDEPP